MSNSKVAVVTGGTSGIGKATALALQKAGCTVYELSRRAEGVEGLRHISADVTDEAAVNAAIDAITEALQQNDKVQLVGFGAFEVKARAERIGRNPRTKEQIKIPASKLPVFKPGKALKDAVAK